MRLIRSIRALPLAARVPLLVAALMIVLGAIASERVLSKLADLQRRQMRELASLYLDGLSVALLPAGLRSDVWEAFDTLDRATHQERSLPALVTTLATADGKVLASSDPSRFPTGALIDPALEKAPIPEALEFGGGDPSVRVRAPLVHQGRVIGELHAELDVTGLLAARRQAVLYLLAGNAMATALLATVGFVLVRRMLRPLATLADHMGREPGPDIIPEREMPKGANEFTRLFRQYNRLVRAERARHDSARRLAEQERLVSLGRLASGVAHEINNPLGGLLNALDTLKHHGDKPGVTERSIALLDRGMRGIRDVVRVLLETYRQENAGAVLAAVDLDDLRLLIGPEIRRQGQALDWTIPPLLAEGANLPSGPVRQAALNLLINASAAAGRGGRVCFEAWCADGALTICVADSGPGLPAASRRLLETGEGNPSGGVGLRVVSEKIRALGGGVRVAASPTGTAIILTIPIPAADGLAA